MVWVVYLCSCAGWSLGLRWVDVVGLMCFGVVVFRCDRACWVWLICCVCVCIGYWFFDFLRVGFVSR